MTLHADLKWVPNSRKFTCRNCRSEGTKGDVRALHRFGKYPLCQNCAQSYQPGSPPQKQESKPERPELEISRVASDQSELVPLIKKLLSYIEAFAYHFDIELPAEDEEQENFAPPELRQAQPTLLKLVPEPTPEELEQKRKVEEDKRKAQEVAYQVHQKQKQDELQAKIQQLQKEANLPNAPDWLKSQVSKEIEALQVTLLN
jgi:hypothetical protein